MSVGGVTVCVLVFPGAEEYGDSRLTLRPIISAGSAHHRRRSDQRDEATHSRRTRSTAGSVALRSPSGRVGCAGQAVAGSSTAEPRGTGVSARARDGRNASAISAPITAAAAASVAVVLMASTNALLAAVTSCAPPPSPICAATSCAAPTLSLAAAD